MSAVPDNYLASVHFLHSCKETPWMRAASCLLSKTTFCGVLLQLSVIVVLYNNLMVHAKS